jgi:hypothetical protein
VTAIKKTLPLFIAAGIFLARCASSPAAENFKKKEPVIDPAFISATDPAHWKAAIRTCNCAEFSKHEKDSLADQLDSAHFVYVSKDSTHAAAHTLAGKSLKGAWLSAKGDTLQRFSIGQYEGAIGGDSLVQTLEEVILANKNSMLFFHSKAFPRQGGKPRDDYIARCQKN